MVLEFYADICWQKYEKKGFKVYCNGIYDISVLRMDEAIFQIFEKYKIIL